MTDADVVAALVEKLNSLQAVAERLGVASQVIVHWRGDRGISWQKRPAVAGLCKELAIELPTDFLAVRRLSASAA